MKRDTFANLIKILITVGLLAVVAFSINLSNVASALASSSWKEAALAMLLFQLRILVRAYRWQVLLESQAVCVSYGRLMNLYYAGTFFNTFLPSGFGGDIVKWYELSRHESSSPLAASTLLVDRLMGIAVLFAMAIMVLPFSWNLIPVAPKWALLALVAGFASILWIFMNRQIVNWLKLHSGTVRALLGNEKVGAFYASFYNYSKKALLKSAGASLVSNILLIAAQVFLAQSVGALVPLGYFFVFVPIISSLLALPISISGFGVREGGYMVLFGQAGVPSDLSVAMSLLFAILSACTGLIGGLIYFACGVRALGHTHGQKPI